MYFLIPKALFYYLCQGWKVLEYQLVPLSVYLIILYRTGLDGSSLRSLRDPEAPSVSSPETWWRVSSLSSYPPVTSSSLFEHTVGPPSTKRGPSLLFLVLWLYTRVCSSPTQCSRGLRCYSSNSKHVMCSLRIGKDLVSHLILNTRKRDLFLHVTTCVYIKM